MKKQSIWEDYATSTKNNINKLKENIRTDVLIIGGGIAGILCAYRLKKAGVQCILVEKENILQGVTRNTTAKITAQHGLIYDKIQKEYGIEKAKLYYEINQKAVDAYWKLSENYLCDLEEKTAYVYSTKNVKKLEEEVKVYEKLNIPFIWRDESPLPFQVKKSLGMKHQAQYNPMKLLTAIAKELTYYENCEVIEIKGNKAILKDKIIHADQMILTTHFPMVNIPGAYFAKMYQERSYALAVKDGPNVAGMYIDEDKKGLSFRNYKDYLIVGGGAHKTGTKGGGFEELMKFVTKEYRGKEISFAWVTQDCMTLDGIPYIGRHSKSRSNLYVATGFNKWGMTGSMSGAMVLEELITKGNSKYSKLFSPSRSMLHPQLAVNLASAVGNIIRPGRRCTHMGCALRWNPSERTWDCPCHGSKYTENGKVLENPAKKNLSH